MSIKEKSKKSVLRFWPLLLFAVVFLLTLTGVRSGIGKYERKMSHRKPALSAHRQTIDLYQREEESYFANTFGLPAFRFYYTPSPYYILQGGFRIHFNLMSEAGTLNGLDVHSTDAIYEELTGPSTAFFWLFFFISAFTGLLSFLEFRYSANREPIVRAKIARFYFRRVFSRVGLVAGIITFAIVTALAVCKLYGYDLFSPVILPALFATVLFNIIAFTAGVLISVSPTLEHRVVILAILFVLFIVIPKIIGHAALDESMSGRIDKLYQNSELHTMDFEGAVESAVETFKNEKRYTGEVPGMVEKLFTNDYSVIRKEEESIIRLERKIWRDTYPKLMYMPYSFTNILITELSNGVINWKDFLRSSKAFKESILKWNTERRLYAAAGIKVKDFQGDIFFNATPRVPGKGKLMGFLIMVFYIVLFVFAGYRLSLIETKPD